MAVYKNENGKGYRIVVTNPTTHKSTTIRRGKNNEPFLRKSEAKEYELYYLKHSINRSMTLDELFRKYIEYLSVRPSSSKDKLTSWYNNNIKQLFGKRKITSITTIDLEHLSREMLNKGYSINYINKNCANIKTMLNWAVDHNLLDINKARNFKPLKKIKKTNDIKYWEPEQFQRVIESIPECYSNVKTDTTYIKYFLMFGYFSGMRKGEQRALKWKDIEINDSYGVIHINHHINEKNEYIVGRKNGNGYALYMDRMLLNLVLEIKNYFSSFEGWSKNAYVFPSLKKGFDYPIGGHSPVRWMEELAEFNGLPHITYHGLRHSYVCYLSSKLGLSVYDVADRIGDTVGVVLEHYYQFFNGSKLEVANKISNHIDPNLQSLLQNQDGGEKG